MALQAVKSVYNMHCQRGDPQKLEYTLEETTMKKLIALVLIAMMAVLTLGCAKKEAVVDNPLGLIEPGKLSVALSPDFAPMEFIDTSKSGQEQFVGFDVTLAKFIASELGLELEIKPMSFDASQTAVQLGKVDMSISGYSWTKERAENYCLSDYYYAGDNETQQTIIVPVDKAGTFAKLEDFQGLKIGAQAASLQENLCNENLTGIVASIELFKDINDAVLAMKTGKIDAIAVAYGNGEAIIASNSDVGMSGFLFEIDESAENNVCMLNKNSTALLAKVNECLKKAYDGKLYGGWYDEAKALSGIATAADISYDDEGNVVG